MRIPLVGAVLLMAGIFSSFGQGDTKSESGIEGVITIAPIRPGPIHRGDERPRSAPLANMTFAVQNEKGRVASFSTDAEGHFRLSLPPGHYTVSLPDRLMPRCGPFDVDVVPGKMTKVEWGCDSGMR